MHVIYHVRITQTHWNDYLGTKTVYKVSIHVLIKTVEGQDVESITAVDYNRNTSEVCRNEGNTPTITC